MASTPALTIRPAVPAEAEAVADLIVRAAGVPEDRRKWVSEAHLLRVPRTDVDEVRADMRTEGVVVLLAVEDEGRIVATCETRDLGDGVAYVGMLAVEPDLQSQGVGGLLARAARQHVVDLGCRAIEIEVLSAQTALLERYAREGFVLTGESRDIPRELTHVDDVRRLRLRLDLDLDATPRAADGVVGRR